MSQNVLGCAIHVRFYWHKVFQNCFEGACTAAALTYQAKNPDPMKLQFVTYLESPIPPNEGIYLKSEFYGPYSLRNGLSGYSSRIQQEELRGLMEKPRNDQGSSEDEGRV